MPDWLSFEPFTRTASCAIDKVIGKLKIPAGSMAQLQSSANYLIARQLSNGIIGTFGRMINRTSAGTTQAKFDNYSQVITTSLSTCDKWTDIFPGTSATLLTLESSTGALRVDDLAVSSLGSGSGLNTLDTYIGPVLQVKNTSMVDITLYLGIPVILDSNATVDKVDSTIYVKMSPLAYLGY